MKKRSSKELVAHILMPVALLAGGMPPLSACAQNLPSGDAARGRAYFQVSCALCHSAELGPDGTVTIKQGPSLVGVVGRRAGSLPHFTYTEALKGSAYTWDAATLDHFLANPMMAVPGTTMPMPVPDAKNRADVVAYLSTLKIPEGVTLKYRIAPPPNEGKDPDDWQREAPGVTHHITVADLPAPYATQSSSYGPEVVAQPDGASPAVPPGFTVKKFAEGDHPRLLRTAPNGDIFIAETARSQIRVMRTADGADAPTVNQLYATGLDRPFGIAFYPPGNDPKWLYVANINSVVRFPYHNGDLQASGPAEIIVPRLTLSSRGNHTTRRFSIECGGGDGPQDAGGNPGMGSRARTGSSMGTRDASR
jgi:cytochrome c2